MGELNKLPNIGERVEQQLNAVNIFTYDDLKKFGAENAWLKIQSIDKSACIHRLLALEGALQGVPKKLLPEDRKAELKKFYEEHKLYKYFSGEIKVYLYHYYDKSGTPFRNLSELPVSEAKAVLEKIKVEKPNSKSAERHDKYVEYRRNCEEILRTEFLKKGGKILRTPPHYMVVEHSPWLSTWFEDCGVVKIPIEEFDTATLSFTYGDSMPTFGINDEKEYRQKLYTYDEILKIIEKYGLPQDWNDDGKHGPERYIEVHVWSDETVGKYR